MTAEAPSLVCEELPAVTVPLTWKAGRSLANASIEVSRRGPSSVSKTISRMFAAPSTRRTVRGTISSLKRPASIAAMARW